MTLARAVIELQGGPGGNGIATFYGLDGPDLRSDVAIFAENWSGILPNDIVLNVPNVGDVINEETGEIVDTWTGGSVVGFTGTAAGTWVAGVGVRIRWRSAGIVAGRRVQGRTFVVPLDAARFDNNGLPTAATIDAVGSWATDLLEGHPGNLQLWSRPSGSRLGSKHTVVSTMVPVEASFLRTRRT